MATDDPPSSRAIRRAVENAPVPVVHHYGKVQHRLGTELVGRIRSIIDGLGTNLVNADSRIRDATAWLTAMRNVPGRVVLSLFERRCQLAGLVMTVTDQVGV